ncbi:L,D-transpeptidase family protein [Paenibacillus sp. UNC499MF]|uniref:L,D-transpeptidase family protein n=1 Tax=Paenibacillus sp. UNC499MF TaxID=1502751 RepID=UPI0008A039C9|nr:L,D-transpeptidase family protein [Paenibacillus sp. UNC499MF]SEF63026.1 Lipoprotein-anchoring transpeptidase ErfK/SrfK [Paenibacillus sp. UNC499MF]
MGGATKRFSHPLEPQLVRVNKNLYISRGDPQYFDKVIRYADKTSPEAHYRMGERARKQGDLSRALFHYQEVMKTYPSPYYSDANRALHELAEREESDLAGVRKELEAATGRKFNKFLRTFLYALIVINLILLVVLLSGEGGKQTASAAENGPPPSYESHAVQPQQGNSFSPEAASLRPEGFSGVEADERPYLVRVVPDTDNARAEALIRREMEHLIGRNPQKSRVIYGIRQRGGTADFSADTAAGQAFPAGGPAELENAFVLAQYVPALRKPVEITYLGEGAPRAEVLTRIGTQLIRTALRTYAADHGGKFPGSLDELVRDYPGNYLSFVPREAVSGSIRVSPSYDGGGGWVYRPAAGDAGSALTPNLPGASLAGVLPPASAAAQANVPFEPVQVKVIKREHRLILTAGGAVLEARAGIGRPESPTPDGTFAVRERVIAPAGGTPGVYGAAALGLGAIAVHGTADAASVGAARSLGCIRLGDADMLALFALVPKGSAVRVAEAASAADGRSAAGVATVGRLDLAAAAAALKPPGAPGVRESAPEGSVFHWLG